MDITLHTLATAIMKTKTDHRPPALPVVEAAPLIEAAAEEDSLDPFVTVTLIRTPNSGMKGLVRIRQQLGLNMSIGELLSRAQHLPLPLLEGVSLSLYLERCAAIVAEEGCIEVADTISQEILDIC